MIGVRVLGGYTITRLLGEGGMGAVYAADHPELNKSVAVKILHPRFTQSPSIAERFLAEARAASALDHPNIIDVIDASTLEDGRYYIALEFLRGKTVGEYCKERGGRIQFDQALRILGQTCCGLAAAHFRGIVHRDLKPANLFIAPTELNPLFTKVLDFGIAKLSDPALAGGIETGTNAVAGTPAYMSPEQARGMRDVDHRSDIYSLGVIAYRMITGRLPYKADSPGELVYQQAMSPPPDPESLRQDLPPAWASLIKSSMLSSPHNRPHGADEFALRLAQGLPDGMAILREVAPHFFTPNWIARTRRISGAAVAEALANTAPAITAAPATISTADDKPVKAPQLVTASYDDSEAAHGPPPPVPPPVVPAPQPMTAPSRSRNRLTLFVTAAAVAVVVVVTALAIRASAGGTGEAPIDAPFVDATSEPALAIDAAPTAITVDGAQEMAVDAAQLAVDAGAPTLDEPRERKRPRRRPRPSKKPPKEFDPDAPLGGT